MKEGYLVETKIRCPDCGDSLYFYHTNLGGCIKVCRRCKPNGFKVLARRAKNIDLNEPSPTKPQRSVRAKVK